MKRFVYAVSGLVLLVLVGCNESPAKTGKDFYYLVEKGKVNDAYNLVTKEGQGLLSMAGGAASFSKLTKEIESKKGIKEIQVVNEEKKGDTATVKVKIIFNSGEPQEDKLDLIKEDGKWKIAINK